MKFRGCWGGATESEEAELEKLCGAQLEETELKTWEGVKGNENLPWYDRDRQIRRKRDRLQSNRRCYSSDVHRFCGRLRVMGLLDLINWYVVPLYPF